MICARAASLDWHGDGITPWSISEKATLEVIPFIASNYRRDKIWLRRTKPSKREYQAGRFGGQVPSVALATAPDQRPSREQERFGSHKGIASQVAIFLAKLLMSNSHVEARQQLLSSCVAMFLTLRSLWPSTTLGACFNLRYSPAFALAICMDESVALRRKECGVGPNALQTLCVLCQACANKFEYSFADPCSHVTCYITQGVGPTRSG